MNRWLPLFICMHLLALTPHISFAEIFRYKDDSGSVHYVDKESKVPERYREQLVGAKPLPKITKMKSPLFATPVNAGNRSTSKKVEIFVTAWCPHCKSLEKFLRKEKIRFTRYDIEKSAAGRKLYKQLGGSGVPVVRIGSKIIRGFSPETIRASLK